MARHANAHRRELTSFEASALQSLIALGLFFWFWVGLAEIDAHVYEAWTPGATLALFAATSMMLEWAGRKLLWMPGRYPAALFVASLLPVLAFWELDLHSHLLGRGGALGWPLSFATRLLVLRRFVPDAPAEARSLHALFLSPSRSARNCRGKAFASWHAGS